ncbi:hypothetical protein LBMAG42_24070 [Deltaproteobacteria bacterium]|nr:hypothetical protein LBMAG42_24070 [Deltaproteobacteria bacterium]
MPAFRVSSRIRGSVDIEAANWLIALGEGLAALGEPTSPDRLACERLMNGTVLVRDVRSGSGFVVQPLGGPEEEAEAEPEPVGDGDDMFPTLCPSDTPDADEEIAELDSDSMIPLELVRDTVASVARAMDIDAALALAVSAGVRLTNARGGSALLLEKIGLRFRYVVGDAATRLRGMRIPANAGVAGYSTNSHTSLIVLNAYADPRFYRNVDRHTGHRTGSLLCVPLAAHGRTFGCLELVDSAPGFSDEHLADMERIAEATAERLSLLVKPD